MTGKKTAVGDIEELLSNYFGQKMGVSTPSSVDGGFINLLEVILKSSDLGSKLFFKLTGPQNRLNRGNPNSEIYKEIYRHIYEEIKNERFAFERNNPKQIAATMFLVSVDRAGKINDRFVRSASIDAESKRELLKLANSLDRRGYYDIADSIDELL